MNSVEVAERETLDEDCLKAAGDRVYSPDGYVGVVEAVRRPREGELPTLGVRAGLFVRRTTLVPGDCVARVVPERRRVLLKAVPAHPSPVAARHRQLLMTVARDGGAN